MNTRYLRMKGISKSFPGVVALKDVTFDAAAGAATALLGANGAGKSTLMNVLGGIVQPDNGEIFIDDQCIQISSPIEATKHGIAFVHQEMALLPKMTVMENMFISTFPKRGGISIDRRTMREECKAVFQRLGRNISPDEFVQNLGTGDRQMVEIGRALLGENRIFIFDEPTSSLTANEKERLVSVIEGLKAEGMTVIYITHFLNEAFEICEQICVLRGGEVVSVQDADKITMPELVKHMVGEVEIESRSGARTGGERDPVLKLENLNRTGVLSDINFTLHRGEILGLWGLLGSGRTEVARALVGLDPADSIKLSLNIGEGFREMQPELAREYIGIITEERRVDGLLLSMSVERNMSAANLPNLRKNIFGSIDLKKETILCEEFVDRLSIKISGQNQIVETLSGGNQQKVIVGRWLELNPPIIIMDEPTRGLDVSAKAEIARIIINLASEGTSIILISSEIDEMLSLCDRFLVMNKGRIIGDYHYGTVTREKLVALAAGAEDYNE